MKKWTLLVILCAIPTLAGIFYLLGIFHNGKAPSSAALYGKSRMVKILQQGNHVPIEFYGRLIDQNSNPVPNISIEGEIQYNNGLHEGMKKILTRSDINGFFQVTGQFGKSVAFSFLDPNFLLSSTNTYFIYSQLWPAAERHQPHSNRPVIFQLWKRAPTHDTLSRVGFSGPVGEWNMPVKIDLVNSSFVQTNGDIVVIFSGQRPTESAIPFWQVQLIAADGGIISVEHDTLLHTYRAPYTGWQTQVQFTPDIGDLGYSPVVNKDILLKSKAGQNYFKLSATLYVGSERRPPSVEFHGLVNTNSSPSWEPEGPKASMF
jgi:hypothetical protein